MRWLPSTNARAKLATVCARPAAARTGSAARGDLATSPARASAPCAWTPTVGAAFGFTDCTTIKSRWAGFRSSRARRARRPGARVRRGAARDAARGARGARRLCVRDDSRLAFSFATGSGDAATMTPAEVAADALTQHLYANVLPLALGPGPQAGDGRIRHPYPRPEGGVGHRARHHGPVCTARGVRARGGQRRSRAYGRRAARAARRPQPRRGRRSARSATGARASVATCAGVAGCAHAGQAGERGSPAVARCSADDEPRQTRAQSRCRRRCRGRRAAAACPRPPARGPRGESRLRVPTKPSSSAAGAAAPRRAPGRSRWQIVVTHRHHEQVRTPRTAPRCSASALGTALGLSLLVAQQPPPSRTSAPQCQRARAAGCGPPAPGRGGRRAAAAARRRCAPAERPAPPPVAAPAARRAGAPPPAGAPRPPAQRRVQTTSASIAPVRTARPSAPVSAGTGTAAGRRTVRKTAPGPPRPRLRRGGVLAGRQPRGGGGRRRRARSLPAWPPPRARRCAP